MEYLQKYGESKYHKIMLVSLSPDGCRILKGPQDEKRLMEFLEDDFHIGRYEKMLQLVVREKVEEDAREQVSRLLSPEYLKMQFCSGKTKVSCSYLRDIDGRLCPVTALVFPRRFGEQGELEEFMIYIIMEGVLPGGAQNGLEIENKN